MKHPCKCLAQTQMNRVYEFDEVNIRVFHPTFKNKLNYIRMKYLVIILFFIYEVPAIGQTIISSDPATADQSAELTVYTSTNKGVLIPQLTTFQMFKILNPADGLLIYNITDNEFNFFNSSSSTWERLSKIPTNTVNPTAQNDGECYFNTSDNRLYYWYAGASTWVKIGVLTAGLP